ncbi:hypothetical protein GCM10027067_21340 [Pseudactinotalea suaedae]
MTGVEREDEVHTREVVGREHARLVLREVEPVAGATAQARWSAPSPTCQLPVPAEHTDTRSSSPARASASVRTAAPRGERQMFPLHTTQIE